MSNLHNTYCDVGECNNETKVCVDGSSVYCTSISSPPVDCAIGELAFACSGGAGPYSTTISYDCTKHKTNRAENILYCCTARLLPSQGCYPSTLQCGASEAAYFCVDPWSAGSSSLQGCISKRSSGGITDYCCASGNGCIGEPYSSSRTSCAPADDRYLCPGATLPKADGLFCVPIPGVDAGVGNREYCCMADAKDGGVSDGGP